MTRDCNGSVVGRLKLEEHCQEEQRPGDNITCGRTLARREHDGCKREAGDGPSRGLSKCEMRTGLMAIERRLEGCGRPPTSEQDQCGWDEAKW